MKKSPKNDFKIESTSSRIKIQVNKFQESREWFQDSTKDEFKIQEKKSRRLHKGSIEKFFQKTNIAQFCFSKEFFSKFSKLPEFLLSGNRLPVSYNQLPVTKFDFKKLSTKFATFQLISKWCNRLQHIGNRLQVYLNIEIQN